MAIKARDAFRTISEVADWLDVPAHVLRFWESKFSQIKPVKRAGGRRYYRPDDMLLIGGIKKLLHDDGMTIRGVQKMLKEEGVKTVAALSQSLDGVDEAATPRTKRRKAEVEAEAKDAPIETGPEKEVVEEAETIAAWAADAEAESAPPEDSRGPIHIDPTAAPAADEALAAEADSSSKPEPETAATEDAADNVVAMPTRAEPEREIEPEPEEAPQTAFNLETAPEAADDAPAASEPEPEAAQPEAEQEQTSTATDMPAEAEEATPEPAAAGPSDAQVAVRALKRSLRGSDSRTLVADPALAAHAARLTALRDRIAAQVAGD